MKSYRSAMGKNVDMGALMAKNENARAVGNMRVNARGDTIDANGRIIKPVTTKVNEAYSNTVGNKSANAVKARPKSGPVASPVKQKPEIKEELTQAEIELDESFEDEIEIEQIKAQETKGKK